jgi:hypothetical protein
MKSILMTALASALLVSSLQAPAAIIDSFEYGAFSLQDNNPNDNGAIGAVQTGLSDVIGGERWPSVLIWQHSGPSASLTLDLSGPGDHGATLRLPGGGTGTAAFLYPGPSGNGIGADLTADGASAFQFLFSADPGNGSLTVSLAAPSGNLLCAVPLTGSGMYMLPFSAFAAQPSDFVNISSIYWEVVFTADGPGTIATLSDVRTVPEPMVLWTLSLGTLFVFRRRRR